MSFELSPTHLSGIRGVGRELKTQNPQLRTSAVVLALGFTLFLYACAHRQIPAPSTSPPQPTPPHEKAPEPAPSSVEEGWTEKGIASWYGEPYHGRRTASGEIYDMHEMTAAHRSLPFGSVVRVVRRDTGADVTVRINDRGPFIEGRIIDLSLAAAKKIDLDTDGVAPVKIKLLGRETTSPRKQPPVEQPEECFWVQVGAFGDSSNAYRAEAGLEKTGETAAVLEGLDGLWRVRIGPFDREKQAEKARDRVVDAWPGAHVIPCGG